MGMTDPIADMFTRIRNANARKHERVDIPYSKLKFQIAGILKDERFIEGFDIVKEKEHENIRIALKYVNEDQEVISGIERCSKPGLRVYVDRKNIPRVKGGFGIAILSTSKGIMTDRKARRSNVGGEVLGYIW
ncbi:MAG: 30S ribosomal protein S8 [Nitrospirota bacterium]